MLYVAVALLINVALWFLLFYITDEPKQWKTRKLDEIYTPFLPVIGELLTDNEQIRIEYKERVIIPSNSYFELKDELNYDRDGDLWYILSVFALDTFFIVSLIKSSVVLAFISIALFVFAPVVAEWIYRKTPLCVKPFPYTKAELREKFLMEKASICYPVEEQYAFNFFVISLQHEYLRSNYKAVRLRRRIEEPIQKTCEVLIGIICVLATINYFFG